MMMSVSQEALIAARIITGLQLTPLYKSSHHCWVLLVDLLCSMVNTVKLALMSKTEVVLYGNTVDVQ